MSTVIPLVALLLISGPANAAEPLRTDRHGDPLPQGAIARLGTVRWRHGLSVNDLAYSPDGKLIAAVGGGRAITLWDAATGKEIHQFPNRNQPNAVAFSPDGKILATTDTPMCRLWDVSSGKELRQLKGHSNGLRSVAFAADGKTIATTSYDETARIWDTDSGKQLRCLECKQGTLYGAAYSPDGKLLATGGSDKTICLWDPATGTKCRQLAGHSKAIWNLVFSPNGKLLASSSEDETVRLWELATGRPVRVFDEKPEGSRLPIAFSPDSAVLALGRWDGSIRLYDMESGKKRRHWQAGAKTVRAVAFAPDGKTLASAGWDGCIRQWDAATGKEKHPSDEHHGFVEMVRFAADGTSLLSFGRDGCLLRWDLATNTPKRQFSWTVKRHSVPALSPDSNTLALDGWPDSHLRLWDVRSGKPGRSLGKQQRMMFGSIAFSPDGRLVAAKDENRLIYVWDVRDGKEIQQFKGHESRTGCLCFSPDSKALAWAMGLPSNGTGERTLRLWDVASGKERCSFASQAAVVEAVAFSPDGKMLASGEQVPGAFLAKSMVRVWDARTGAELSRHTGRGQSIGALAFSPDSKLVAGGAYSWGDRDNSVRVLEAATGRLIRRFEGHHSGVGGVDFSPDGLIVASGAGDSTIFLWDISGRRGDGRWHKQPLTPRELQSCWTALANPDATRAYDAVWALVAAPEQAVSYLQKHLPPMPHPVAKTIARLIVDLDSDNFMVRQKATEELSKFGETAAPALRQVLAGKLSLEMRLRVQQLLDQSRGDWTPERLRDHRAIQALEHIGTRQAKEVLQNLAAGAPGTLRTDEANAALRRWKR